MKACIGSLLGLVLSISVGAEPLLEGRVRLAAGEPAAGAQVRLFDLTDPREWVGATTDEAGYFALPLRALPGAAALPARFALGPNYPNPFNPSTIIPYQLAASSAVRLEVFNLLGQRIATLVDGERPAGFHTATWHATDGAGRAVGAGVYIYRMTVGMESQTGRMVLLDGQAGVSAGGMASVMPGAADGRGSDGAASQVYGLVVSGAGLAPYVDSSFRVEAGMAPVELVVSSGSWGGQAADDACAFCDLFALHDDEEGPGPSGKAQAALDAPPAPTNLRFDAPTNSSCTVRWDAALGATDYDVNYRPAVGGRWTNQPHRGTRLYTTINDLEPGTEYVWAVRAENSDGASAWVFGPNFTTLEEAADDRATLVALYNATNGDNWKNNTNWLSDKPLGEWYGVTTDASGRVTRLELGYNRLTGTIPSQLGDLTNLRLLWLAYNQLSGSIPSSLGNLTNLRILDLHNNNLSGSIPSSLGNLTNLELLFLQNNQLSGCVPAGLRVGTHDVDFLGLPDCDGGGRTVPDRDALVALYHATDGDNWKRNTNWLSDKPLDEWYGVWTDASGRVTRLQLGSLFGSNNLSGSIPQELGSLSNLEELLLPHNQLSGRLPSSLGNLTNLQRLWLHDNELSGSIPSSLGDLTNLRLLYLHDNELSGSIPSSLGNLTNLQRLELRDNELSGSIPSSLGDLTNLLDLGLNGNRLSGSIPSSLGDLTNLRLLYLHDNDLSGRIPSSLGNLTNLRLLWLASNQLSGSIPSSLGNLTNLQVLDLSNNRLTGTIPSQLGNLTNLALLFLQNNQLSGCIPAGLRDVGNNDLDQLGLSDCGGGGGRTVPDRDALVALYHATDGANWKNNTNWLSNKPLDEWYGVTTDASGRVTSLVLGSFFSGNDLSGSIPQELGSLSNLEELRLSRNDLSGRIPSSLGNLTNLTWLWLHDNELSGSIPSSLGDLTNLRLLYLNDNDLSGSIPSSLGNLTNLQWLYLSGNRLSGSIPSSLGDLTNLLGLDLSGNRLSGSIPSSLGNLTNLQSLRLGGNQLSGCIPAGLRDVGNNDLDQLGLSDCGGGGRTVPDRAALVALYRATDGDNWRNNTNWLSNKPLDEWYGVTTDASGRVTRLSLGSPFRGNRLSGSIPSALGNLTNLQVLYLSRNELSGSIPSSLGNLTNLQQLDLSGNELSGSIPSSLGNLTNLRHLWLRGNELSGCIPAGLRDVGNNDLDQLGLSDCGGGGGGRTVPDRDALVALYRATDGDNWRNNTNWLSNKPLGEWYGVTTDASGRVTGLVLPNNRLTGTIPSSLGNLTNLQWLNLSFNGLSGSIPSSLGNLTNLQSLGLSFNGLSGSIPSSLGNLTNLQSLGLSFNELSGCIPAGLRDVENNDLDQLGLSDCAS